LKHVKIYTVIFIRVKEDIEMFGNSSLNGPSEREFLGILASREERAFAQKFLLGVRYVNYVVQMSLNIPGFPKDVPEGGEALRLASSVFLASSRERPLAALSMSGQAGRAELMAFAGDAPAAKALAVAVEEENEWGRAVDADVITTLGPISRPSVGLAPRACLLCGEPAKMCARSRRHDADEVRAEAIRLLGLARR
jgi:holo-ACP synthase